MNACGSETCSGKSEQVQSEMHGGEVAWILLQVVPLLVVDFDGRFRMVRTIKRANTDDRWKVRVTKGPFPGRRFGVNASRIHLFERNWEGGKSIPLAQRLERHPVDALPPDPNRDQVPRRLYLKQSDFMAHRFPGCMAFSGGRAQGHTEECRIRVEGELRKTEEE